MDIEKYKKYRKVLRSKFTKLANDFNSQLIDENISPDYVKNTWELVKDKYDAIRQVDELMCQELLDKNSDEESLSEEMDGRDKYFKTYTELSRKFEQFCNQYCGKREDDLLSASEVPVGAADYKTLSRVSSTIPNIAGNKGRRFKLPVIELKKFSGDIREWLGFWAQFKNIHEDPDIDSSDKISYLLQATVPGSRARQLVESFPAMHENYDKIIDSFKTRFGREELQIEVYVRELLKLVICNSVSQEKTDISALYDKIESQLRALETLGITKSRSASMLFPLIESCLPESLLRVWQRSSYFGAAADSINGLENRLQGLMEFLRSEVESEQRILLATESFGLNSMSASKGSNCSKMWKQKHLSKDLDRTPTAAGLVNHDVSCIFCDGTHEAENCFKAQKYSFSEKKDALSRKGACYRCLKRGHLSRKCRVRVRCVVCGKSHVALMCPDLANHSEEKASVNVNTSQKGKEEEACTVNQTLSCQTNGQVFLQTLKVTISNGTHKRNIRILLDSGSQRSYILNSTAEKLGFLPNKIVKMRHALFGGQNTSERSHKCYKIRLSNNDYSCNLDVLDEPQICSDIQYIHDGDWINELRSQNIHLSDVDGPGPIEVLLGADVIGKLYTGRRHVLQSGLVAMQTLLGWTIMGKVCCNEKNMNMINISLLVKDYSLSDLWRLDVLGITDPGETKNKEEMALAAKKLFQQTVCIDEDGRYIVRLPWLDGHPALSSNYSVAKKRLDSTIRKLKRDSLYECYDRVFIDWLREGIIEEVPETELNYFGHYLPHRAVVKEGSTTKIRPVFDASSCEKGKPSLNSCLEVGPNLIELIPTILLRFRMFKLGVVSDIKKAFLQIGLQRSDMDFLRFLWINPSGKEITYRHKRVVFGVSSSPFLLGATIEHHLMQCKEKRLISSNDSYSVGTITQLLKSFYVDNCVTSVRTEEELVKFIKEASMLMDEACFDLRGWEYTSKNSDNVFIYVLGLRWNPLNDVLSISDNITEFQHEVVTKRQILSYAQRIFDPIGFTSPATLYPKLMLQRTWKQNLGWDDPVDEELRNEFVLWAKEIHLLSTVKIPRWIQGETDQGCSLHVFCDASKDAYAAAVYLRTKWNGEVFVHLLAAKTRVAPLKPLTIPRLELMAATIGARLYHNVKMNFERPIECNFWTDSSTVIFWIRKPEEWSTFISNRVKEIKTLTPVECWRHVPGHSNPADLPSRGCSIKQLIELKWWEGPQWLYDEPQEWPTTPILNYDEAEISQERKKKLCNVMISSDSQIPDWHFDHFSKYFKIVRMVGWVFRFINNSGKMQQYRTGALSVEELDMAEKFVIKTIQNEAFTKLDEDKLVKLNPFRDQSGIIRLRSRISQRDDFNDFRYPILLPSKNTVVSKLIFDMHVNSSHAGIQALMSLLREKRYTTKRLETVPALLPMERVRDAAVFEVTGVDFTGPLYLKTGEKAWICLFTCAVYRAVHLEITTSLSTAGFIQVLRRFISRRGRPTMIFSDNGTNFVGTENAFRKLNWQEIVDFGTAQRISWRFTPPASPWWGGFWERLIGVLKQLLRKILRRACLSYEELMTIVCDCESVVNSRPLTYLSDDSSDLVPVTPNMFLREIVESGVPDCDKVDRGTLTKRIAYQQQLRDALRTRFRTEYLGQLKQTIKAKASRQININEVVLIGSDNTKRIDWPLGRVIEMIPGRDGEIRLVRLQTSHGQLLRPLQRLYPLEVVGDCDLAVVSQREDVMNQTCSHPSPKEVDKEGKSDSGSSGVCSAQSTESRVPVKVTRKGRLIKAPQRYQ